MTITAPLRWTRVRRGYYRAEDLRGNRFVVRQYGGTWYAELNEVQIDAQTTKSAVVRFVESSRQGIYSQQEPRRVVATRLDVVDDAYATRATRRQDLNDKIVAAAGELVDARQHVEQAQDHLSALLAELRQLSEVRGELG